MRFVKFITGLLIAVALAGCAGGGAGVTEPTAPVSYVSPIMYETFDCDQIAIEAKALSNQTQQISGFSNAKASGDAVIIWPAGLIVEGNSPAAAKLGRIKYQFEALEKASVREKCKFRFKRTTDETEQKSAQSDSGAKHS